MQGRSRINVAVIGAGTGLTAAWALECQPEFKVSVFESSNRLGGHIHTILTPDGVPLEGGAEFIGGNDIYSNVHKLFKLLGVQLDKYELNIQFEDLQNSAYKLTLPPVAHVSNGKNETKKKAGDACLAFISLFNCNKTQPDTCVDESTLEYHFPDLLNFLATIIEAKDNSLKANKFISLEEFVEHFKTSWGASLTRRGEFADHIMYPLIAAGWGVSVDVIKKFGALYALHYITAKNQWYDAPTGLSTYIEKMQAQCTNTEIHKNTAIKKLIPVVIDGQLKYKLQKSDDTFVVDERGQQAIYEDVMLSTPAYVTQQLIADITTASVAPLIADLPEQTRAAINTKVQKIEQLREKLSNVVYYDTTVVFHQDPKYMSDENVVVHTRKDEFGAANTMCKRWKFDEKSIPYMKSWVLPGQPMPENIFMTVHYKHPEMTESYYDAQLALNAAQGTLGLNFGGILSGFNDSHESGVSVSLAVAARLCEREHCLALNKRLQVFRPQHNDEIEDLNTHRALAFRV